MIDFCSRVREGSRLEIFDIYMFDNLEKILENIDTETQKNDLISQSSFFYSYFLYKIASVLDISEEKMFTTTYAYKPKFIRKLLSESLVSHFALDNYRANSIAKLVSKKKIMAQTFLLIRWVIISKQDVRQSEQASFEKRAFDSEDPNQYLLDTLLFILPQTITLLLSHNVLLTADLESAIASHKQRLLHGNRNTCPAVSVPSDRLHSNHTRQP